MITLICNCHNHNNTVSLPKLLLLLGRLEVFKKPLRKMSPNLACKEHFHWQCDKSIIFWLIFLIWKLFLWIDIYCQNLFFSNCHLRHSVGKCQQLVRVPPAQCNMAPSVKTPPFVCWKIEKSIIKLSFSQSLVSPRRKRKDNQS